MTPRSYEFTCKSCGKTVTEPSDSEVCGNCAMKTPGAAPARPSPPPKKSGFSVTVRSGPKCEFCGGKGTVGSRPCPRCGGKK